MAAKMKFEGFGITEERGVPVVYVVSRGIRPAGWATDDRIAVRSCHREDDSILSAATVCEQVTGAANKVSLPSLPTISSRPSPPVSESFPRPPLSRSPPAEPSMDHHRPHRAACHSRPSDQSVVSSTTFEAGVTVTRSDQHVAKA